MEAILWRMWRHVITWPLSSLKCIGQRSRRFQKVIINKMGVLGGYFQLRDEGQQEREHSTSEDSDIDESSQAQGRLVNTDWWGFVYLCGRDLHFCLAWEGYNYLQHINSNCTHTHLHISYKILLRSRAWVAQWWIDLIWFWFIVFNATFINISTRSWRPVLVVEEARVPVENHRKWAGNW
jgi:hypothetical protein